MKRTALVIVVALGAWYALLIVHESGHILAARWIAAEEERGLPEAQRVVDVYHVSEVAAATTPAERRCTGRGPRRRGRGARTGWFNW